MSIYTPPATNAVDFPLEGYTPADLTPASTALSSYTPPALTAVNFAITAYSAPTYPYVGWELLPSGATGTLAATEAQDVAAFAGEIGHTGTLAATEAQDAASIAGTVTAGVSITGTLDATEAQDVAAFEGTASQQVIWLGGSEAKKKTKRKNHAQEWKEQQELRREQIAQAVMAKTQAAVMREALVPPVQEKRVLPVLQVEQEDEDELLLMLAA